MNKYIGIDVAKATLQVHIPINNKDLEIANSDTGLKQLYAKLKKQYKKDISELVFVYEPTGSYSTRLDRFCMDQKVFTFKVKPSQSSAFAKTLGHRNKSDKIDARLLHRIGILAREKDIVIPAIDEDAHKLTSFFKYARRLMKERVALTNYLEAAIHHQEDTFIIRRIRANIKRLQSEEDEIFQRMLELINANKEYKQSYENITSIKGIGPAGGIALMYLFARYPNASRRGITALCGLDPIISESGTSVQKKARISKQGNRAIRATFFMSSICATIHNDEMKTFYNHLKDRGKHSTVAHIAVMRKLILLAFSLYKNNEQYDPERYLKYHQAKQEKNVA